MPKPANHRRRKATIIGSGPNGLAAAIVLAQAGLDVTVYEAQPTIGGACRTMDLTLPGFHHDFGSAVHPMAVGSPFFSSLPLADYGLEWIHPPAPLAHPFDDGTAIILPRALTEAAAALGEDGPAWRNLFEPLAAKLGRLNRRHPPPHPRPPAAPTPSRPLRPQRHPPRHHTRPPSLPHRTRARPLRRTRRTLFSLARRASLRILRPRPRSLRARRRLAHPPRRRAVPRQRPGRATSCTSAATLSPPRRSTASAISRPPTSPSATSPPANSSPSSLPINSLLLYRRNLGRYKYGPAAFKVDYALSAPIPWNAPACRDAATVHLGGTLAEITASESAMANGRTAQKPFVLLSQPTLFDPTRAPAGQHIAWAYCHVPNGSTEDMLPNLESQIERFANGFSSTILARHISTPATLESMDANLIGGDISGGAYSPGQLLFRPTHRQYRTSAPNLYLCSASTPPGGGVHGMCGANAARQALRDLDR